LGVVFIVDEIEFRAFSQIKALRKHFEIDDISSIRNKGPFKFFVIGLLFRKKDSFLGNQNVTSHEGG